MRALEESRSRAEVAAERSSNAGRLLSMTREELRKASSRWERSRRELEDLDRTASSVLKDLSEGGRAYHASWSLLQSPASSQAMDADHAGPWQPSNLPGKGRPWRRPGWRAWTWGYARRNSGWSRRGPRWRIDRYVEERFPYPGGDGIDTREYERIRRMSGIGKEPSGDRRC